MAVDEINEAGGLFGRPVTLVDRDEGSEPAAGSAALASLADTNIDAIIGPASSRLALATIPLINRLQRPTCSPAAHGLSVAEVTDGGFFFRTIPSEALEARALAAVISSTGRRSTSILYSDDSHGLAWASTMAAELRRNGSSRVTTISYDPALSDNEQAVGRALGDGVPESIAVIGSPESASPILTTLREKGAGPQQVPTFVNDALRVPDLHRFMTQATPDFTERIEGVSPAVLPGPPSWQERYAARFPNSPAGYAAYAYDCVMLIALAAAGARTDAGFGIAERMTDTSRGGTQCRTIDTCLALVNEGLNLDYEGASGSVDLTDSGDVMSGYFDQFRLDATGYDEKIGSRWVTSG